ncbi:MAG: hypothetical protein ACE5OR_09740 [bacterium]
MAERVSGEKQAKRAHKTDDNPPEDIEADHRAYEEQSDKNEKTISFQTPKFVLLLWRERAH